MRIGFNQFGDPASRLFTAHAVAFALAAVIVGCGTSTPPPTSLMAVSSAALSDAVSAGGNEFAPAEMRTARDKLDRAKTAMTAEEYELARSLALEVQVDAQLAQAKAHTAKALQAAAAVKADSKALSEEMQRKTK